MKVFDAAQVSQTIGSHKESILNLCLENGYLEDKKRIEKELKELNQENQILITFIGQYSAGKSTIVSALTGRSDIKIDADIATSEVTRYNWSDQLVLVDTPGLHTENKEHDELTREAILKSDILVYCITNELFDSITKTDYIHLLYEKHYKGKVFLIVNKMSREFGEYDILKENYIDSINDSLSPYQIQDVTYNFIDANDYLDGLSENSQELIDYSHFEEFIDNLNNFVHNNKLLGKLSKPIDLMIISINELLNKNINNKTDKNTINVINRLSKDLTRSRDTFEKKSLSTVENNLFELQSYGNQVVRRIGNTELDAEEFNRTIVEISDNICKELESIREESIGSLKEDLNLILDSNSGQLLFENIKSKSGFIDINFNSTSDDKVSNILDIIDKIPKDSQIIDKIKVPINAGARDVAQGKVHKFVKGVGDTIGYKFKPWQAVNIAKNIGKGISILGVGLEIVSVVKGIEEDSEQEEANRELMNAKKELRVSIDNMVLEIKTYYKNIVDDGLSWYDDAQYLLQELNDEIISKNSKANTLNESLLSMRDNLEDLKKDLKKELNKGEINE